MSVPSTRLPEFSSDTPLYVVLNHRSGSDAADDERRIIEGVLDDAKRTHEILAIDGNEPVAAVAARAVAKARAADGAVVAAGGDGTLNAVAHATLGSGCAYGVIPQGTFNYFSRTHGIPADTEAATRALLRARVRAVQVGLVNDRTFLVNASLGLYPKLLQDREVYKGLFGRSRLVAAGSAIMTLMSRHPPLHLTLARGADANDCDVSTLFIANNALQLEQIGIDESRLDGHLVAITTQPTSVTRLFTLVAHAIASRLDAAAEVGHFGFDRLTVTPRRTRRATAVKVAVDGEVLRLAPPLVFRVSPEPLALLAPHPDDAVART